MKRLNKKGFTLVELLAVIVVLAVIMVIATQAIGGVLAKNKVDAFKSSLDMAAKQAKMAYTQYDETLTEARVEEYLDFDPNQFRVTSVSDSADADSLLDTVCITSQSTGKFTKMDKTIFLESDGVTPKTGYDGWTYTSDQTTACKKFR